MQTTSHNVNAAEKRPAFYTVAEAARLLRVNRATIYRAIGDDAFPAVRVRGRYLIPAVALDQLAAEAASSGAVVDVAAIATTRRLGREGAQVIGGRQ
jgi:excisionase family DNA binding protein